MVGVAVMLAGLEGDAVTEGLPAAVGEGETLWAGLGDGLGL